MKITIQHAKDGFGNIQWFGFNIDKCILNAIEFRRVWTITLFTWHIIFWEDIIRRNKNALHNNL